MTKVTAKSVDISHKHAILLYIVVSLFLFFEMGVQVSPSVMANQLMHDLDLGSFYLGLMSGFYFYSYTAMQLPSGVLFDRFNPRKIITGSIILCVLGTGLFATAHSIYAGCFARLLMGSGSAFAFVSVLVVTADLFQEKYFATMTGITQMLAAFGAMSGQLPVSLLVNSIGWRQTLYVLSAIGIVLALLVWTLLRYEKAPHPKQAGNDSIRYHLKAILIDKQMWIIAVYACLLWAPMSGFTSLWGVAYLTTVNNINPHLAALLCSLMWLGLAIASPILGMLSTAFHTRVYPLALSALIGAIAFVLILALPLHPVILGLCLFLAGGACAGQALSFSVVNEINPPTRRATAIAFNNMAVVISGAIFQPLIGKLLELFNPQDAAKFVYNASAFREAMVSILACYVIAYIVAYWFIKESLTKQ